MDGGVGSALYSSRRSAAVSTAASGTYASVRSITLRSSRTLTGHGRADSSAQKNAARAVVLVAAEESYRVRRSLFQNGRATSIELTDADTELTRARLDLIAARIAARVAHVQFLHATCQDGT